MNSQLDWWIRDTIRALCGNTHIFPQRDRQSAIAHHSLLPSRPMIAWNDFCRGMKSIDWELIWRSKIRFVFLREIRYEILIEQRNSLFLRRLKLTKKIGRLFTFRVSMPFKIRQLKYLLEFRGHLLVVYWKWSFWVRVHKIMRSDVTHLLQCINVHWKTSNLLLAWDELAVADLRWTRTPTVANVCSLFSYVSSFYPYFSFFPLEVVFQTEKKSQ